MVGGEACRFLLVSGGKYGIFEKTPKQKHLNMNVCGVKYEKLY